MHMTGPKLTDAQHAELHEILAHLGAERAWELRASQVCGRVVLAHLSKCPECRLLQDALMETKLAQMDPARRKRFEEVARCLAGQFISGNSRRPGLLPGE
jgi:predicted anti-sigma-YlaC factor YlaD